MINNKSFSLYDTSHIFIIAKLSILDPRSSSVIIISDFNSYHPLFTTSVVISAVSSCCWKVNKLIVNIVIVFYN